MSQWIRHIYSDLRDGEARPADPNSLLIVPSPIDLIDPKSEINEAAASIDLRLGCYFIVFNRSNLAALEPGSGRLEDVAQYQTKTYIPLGMSMCLQPGEFVLGATLEWIKIPCTKSAFVIGKSSVGRTGLIIETAGMIHPAFSGTLTLEISNLSGVAIHLFPGMSICQLVLEECSYVEGKEGEEMVINPSEHVGAKEPRLGGIIWNKRVKSIKQKARQIYGMK